MFIVHTMIMRMDTHAENTIVERTSMDVQEIINLMPLYIAN